MSNPNGWTSDAKMVLHRLDRIDRELRDIEGRLQKIEGKLWVLSTKASLFGALAGSIPALIALWRLS